MKILLTILLCVFPSLCLAIDNPDAPNYLVEFDNRIASIQKNINDNSKTTVDYSNGYKNLENILEKELNTAYQKLIDKLNKDQKEILKQSQSQWVSFRDKEFEFISNNWNTQRFGSSSAISIGDYRTQTIINRVRQLLMYLKNYS
ncbi:MAG: DUF1311 domain-containing protein [Bacteroidetes bacterium]|nr:DUF1311 domain-containing protein [Bacteroidota bacterium]